jgi:uncharacterized protein YkwD
MRAHDEAEAFVRRKPVIAIAGGVVAALALVSLLVVARTTQPHYEAERNGVALGPSVHHSRAASDVLVEVAAGALTSAAGNSNGGLAPGVDTTATADEQALLDLTNADRAQNGLQPVAFDAASLQVARVRAAAQIPSEALSHYNSLGELAFIGLLGDAGVAYSLAGENLALTSRDTSMAIRVNDSLMNSPTHRANILEPTFNWLAVGAASGSDGRLAFAEIFRSSDP